MKKKPLSRNAYFSAAVIIFIYMLAMIFKGYLFQIFPATEEGPLEEVSRIGIPPLLLSSFLMLILSFAILYPVLVICKYHYTTSPIAAIIIFLGIFFSSLTEIILEARYLFRMVLVLGPMLRNTDGPHLREDVMREVDNFLNLRRNLNFPVTVAQIISSIMLVVTFSRQLKINLLIRLAFGINAVYMIIHLGCLFMSLYEPINYNSTLHLPIALFIYGLVLVWFIRMPYLTRSGGD